MKENNRIKISKDVAYWGDYVKITCDNELLTTPTMWEFNKGFHDRYAQKNNFREIEIPHVHNDNAGRYACFGGYRKTIEEFDWFVAYTALKVLGEYKDVWQVSNLAGCN